MKKVRMISLLMLLIPAISFAGVTKKVIERYPPLTSGDSALPGNPKTTVYTDSKGKEIARELCDETGKAITTTGAIPDGLVKEYYENGAVLADYYYKGDKLEGTSKGYFQNGTLRGTWDYKGGKLDGKITSYYTNGKLNFEFGYKNDMRNGTSKYYDENGNLTYEWSYKDEELDGVSKGYYANGKLRVAYNYKNGERDGECKTYHENGKLKLLENYKMGTIISKTEYDNKGTIIPDKDHSVEKKQGK